MKTKKISAAIAFALTLAFVTMLIVVPIVSAHTPPWTIATYAFVVPSPNPIGVGQTGTINMWIDKVPPTAFWQYGDRWEGFNIELTKPSGGKVSLGPFRSDDIGGTFTRYTPDETGTWHVKFTFAAQKIVGANPGPGGSRALWTLNDTYAASSAEADWVVQEEPVEPTPAVPFPTGYWTRPAYGQNAEWWPYVGDWLNVDAGQTVSQNLYTKAPESAHIMWTKPIALGGVAGGEQAQYDWNYYSGLAYESKFRSVVIMAGMLIYALPLGTSGSGGGVDCVDLRTGELLWHSENMTGLSYGINYDYVSPNEFGVKPYLVNAAGTTYYYFDPFTGKQLFQIVNVTAPGSRVTFGPKGEPMIYLLDGTNSWLALWNFSKCLLYYQQGNLWMWRPNNLKMDFKYGIEWNVTTPVYKEPQAQRIKGIDLDAGVIFCFTYWSEGSGAAPWIWEIGYSTKDGHELWHVNRTAPFTGGMISWSTVTLSAAVGDGVFVEYYPEKMIWYGYDIKTGNRIWGPTEPSPNSWGFYTWQVRIFYGMLIAVDFAGYIHAYDIHTGEWKWSYNSGPAGYDTPYGIYVIETPVCAADGKIYVTHGHGYSPPIFKGATLTCLNATDGTVMWETLQYNDRTGMAIADGYVACYNIYDGQVYSFGKGPSQTTVTAPDAAITLGQSLEIRGTVTDTCAGAQKLVKEGKFASVAAVSDASQQGWMEYLYMQQSYPTDCTGVQVSLDSYDPNNNFVHIGTATTDTSGTFHFRYEPPVPGEYTVIATFAGSKSYGPSFAETAFSVDEAAPTPETPEIPVPADYTNMLYGIFGGVVAAIIIGLAALFFSMRKK